ncbi:hypothetical protein ACHAC9_16320 [Massilia sp. CMS3.1]|uniref:hypothetical protein n=1 Tax=Massilia sp. CMS3.1 TaxID=3373083 RepID=UPI003EE63C0F
MHSIDLSRFLAAAVLAVTCYSALAAPPSPRILSEPVLGLRYEAAHVKFDPLPIQASANCENLADNENRQSVGLSTGRLRIRRAELTMPAAVTISPKICQANHNLQPVTLAWCVTHSMPDYSMMK